MTQLELAELQRLQQETEAYRAMKEYYEALRQQIPMSHEPYPYPWPYGKPTVTWIAQTVSDAYKNAEWE